MTIVKRNVISFLIFVFLTVFYIIDAIFHFLFPSKSRRKDVSGDVVLVTGGGGGLGRLLAEKFSKLGCTVVVWDINKEAIEGTVKMVKSQGGLAHGYVCDITDREMVYRMADTIQREVGKVSILVNNAGIVSGKPLLETPDHLIQKTFDVNVISHFWTTKAFLPGMIASKRGHIVTIASMAGIVGMTKLVDYCASKFAALGFDESLRIELESQGHKEIKTTAVCPYFIKSTGMFDGVDTRLVPILEASYVADKVVLAVVTNKKQVYLPWFFEILIWFKGIMPWPVVSMVLKALVHDAHPDSTAKKRDADAIKKIHDFLQHSNSVLETTKNLEQTYRDSAVMERKP